MKTSPSKKLYDGILVVTRKATLFSTTPYDSDCPTSCRLKANPNFGSQRVTVPCVKDRLQIDVDLRITFFVQIETKNQLPPTLLGAKSAITLKLNRTWPIAVIGTVHSASVVISCEVIVPVATFVTTNS